MQLQTGNLFSGEARRDGEERIDMLVTGQRLNVERIVSMGHTSPDGFWYDDSRAEWVVLLGRGRARVRGRRDAARYASRRLCADRAALPASGCVDA
jgi:cupin 2 domain-containing protein